MERSKHLSLILLMLFLILVIVIFPYIILNIPSAGIANIENKSEEQTGASSEFLQKCLSFYPDDRNVRLFFITAFYQDSSFCENVTTLSKESINPEHFLNNFSSEADCKAILNSSSFTPLNPATYLKSFNNITFEPDCYHWKTPGTGNTATFGFTCETNWIDAKYNYTFLASENQRTRCLTEPLKVSLEVRIRNENIEPLDTSDVIKDSELAIYYDPNMNESLSLIENLAPALSRYENEPRNFTTDEFRIVRNIFNYYESPSRNYVLTNLGLISYYENHTLRISFFPGFYC